MEKRQNLLFKIAGAMFVLIFLDIGWSFISAIKNCLVYYSEYLEFAEVEYVDIADALVKNIIASALRYIPVLIITLVIVLLLLKRKKGKLLGAAFILYTILPVILSFALHCIFDTSFSFLKTVTFNNFVLLLFSLIVIFEDKLGRLKEKAVYLAVSLFVFKDIYYLIKWIIQIYINPDNYYESDYTGLRLYPFVVNVELLNIMPKLFSGLILSMACISILAVILNKSADEKSIRLNKIGLAGIPVFAVITVLSIIEFIIYSLIHRSAGREIELIFTAAFYLDIFILLVGFILITLALLNPGNGIAAAAKDILNNGKSDSANIITTESGYINIGVHIVLCLFTFGIWKLIWVYRTTAYLNRTPNSEQYSPLSKLLLFMFIPFYSIYWYYRHGQRADILSRSKNINSSDISSLCLVMAIFIPVVACIILQDRINNISRPKSVAVSASYPTPASAFSAEQPSDEKNLENLKLLKELLDAGAITQEEYDAKKSKFLNL